MFNLEKEIKSWKRSLRKYQSMEDGYVDELENHLRDEVDSLLSKGKTSKEAFQLAAKKIGDVEGIGSEYYVNDTKKICKRPPWQELPFIPSLLLNYLRIAGRQVTRNLGYSFINIFGLSIGLTCVIILGMVIQYELNYDSFFEDGDQIYRVYIQGERNGEEFNMAPVMLPFVPAIKEDVPEIEHAVRVSSEYLLVQNEDKGFFERVIYADEDLFKVLSFPILEGNKDNFLKEPNSILLSENRAKRYFEDESPLGKMLILGRNKSYKVTGVFEDVPHNSHLKRDVILSISSLQNEDPERFTAWTSLSNDYTYVKLKENVTPELVESKFAQVISKNLSPEDASLYTMKLLPLSEIHFSNLAYDIARTVPDAYLIAFGSIAIFILLVACINFINLSTARSVRRSREVGVRKTVGARKGQVILQFLSEAFLYVFLAYFLAFVFVYLVLPETNELLRSQMNFTSLFNSTNIFYFGVMFLVTTLLSGAYPSFILSKFKPTLTLKSQNSSGGKSRFRESLVVFQFSISIFLIIGTITIHNQIKHLEEQDLGFDSERIAVIPIMDEKLMESPEPLVNAIEQLPLVEMVSLSHGTPASGDSQTSNVSADDMDEDVYMQILNADEKFFDTYGLEMYEGRFYSSDYSTDLTDAYVINETAMEKLGWTSAKGKRLGIGDETRKPIIGVVKDFNYSSLKNEVKPMVLKYKENEMKFCSVKLLPGDKIEVMDRIEEVYTELSGGYPFDGYLMDQQYLRYYRNEGRMGKLLFVFASLAIIISCLGILGLVSFTVEQKRKEISVRKVLGAPVHTILQLLGKRFVRWVLIANVIVYPIANYFLESWLEDYAYRIDVNYSVFLMAALCSITLALIAVGYHVLKAALSNPIDSIRYE